MKEKLIHHKMVKVDCLPRHLNDYLKSRDKTKGTSEFSVTSLGDKFCHLKNFNEGMLGTKQILKSDKDLKLNEKASRHQGRNFLHAPQDIRVNLRSDLPPDTN